MAADCHRRQQSSQPEQYHRQVDPAIWKACAGSTVKMPAVDSRVYYFPQGHMEHSSDSQSVLPLISHLTPTPFHICRVLQVLYLVDPESDEVFTRIRLEPLSKGRILGPSPFPEVEESSEESSAVVAFAKILTPSDANNGGGFSVPRSCAESIFPPLNFQADPPVQTLHTADLRGNTWNFRHIYRGTPRRHLLTTGWSKYVNSKRLICGDSVVFMKNNVTGTIYLGVRRAKKSISNAEVAERWAATYRRSMGLGDGEASLPIEPVEKKQGKVPPESVAEALQLAADRKPFEVIYYPKAGSQNFLVALKKVEAAMAVPWKLGFRVKMEVETEDSSRFTCIEGTVSFAFPIDGSTWQASPWSMLEVAWDHDAEGVKNMERVNPWLVEAAGQSSLPLALPFKKLKLNHNGDFSDSQNYNIIPAAAAGGNWNGMQGARQSTHLGAAGGGGGVGCSSQSPDSSISFKTPSPEVTTHVSRSAAAATNSVRLFGQTIYTADDDSTSDALSLSLATQGPLPK